MNALVFLLALTGTIRVSVEGGATEVVAYFRGEAVGRAVVNDGVAVLRDLSQSPVDLVALGEQVRSEVVRHVRPARGESGFDARLVARAAHRLTIRTEQGANAHVGGIRLPVDRVLLLPGLHRVVVDHPRFVSSAAQLVRVDRDLTIDVALDSGLVVAGSVLGYDGNPLAGATIEVFTDGYAARRSVTSDANGGYAVSGFRGDVVSLRIRSDGHATRRVRIPFDPGSERARLSVHLVRGVAVTLPIEGADGPVRATLLPDWFERALEEPRLRVNDEPARATGRERVEFAGLTAGLRYRILLECPGFLPAATPVFEAGRNPKQAFEGRRVTTLEPLPLQRGATLHGKLKGPELPVDWGRIVVARGGFGDRTCRLDRNGEFRFPGLPEGKVLLLLRDLDERGTVFKVKGRGEEEVVLEYAVADAERVLEGTVLDSERLPLGGVRVTYGYRQTLTDAKGQFRLERMPLGRDRFALHVTPTPSSRGFREAPHLPRVERKARFGIRALAQLERAGTLAVRWQDARLARATLYLAGTSGEEMRWRIPRGARGMTVGEIPVGSYVIEVGAPGYLGTGGAVAQVGTVAGDGVEVTLLRGRSVSGRVVRRRGIFRDGRPPQLIDTPISSGSVSLYDLAGRAALATAPIAADGSFLLEGLPAVPILLVAATRGTPVGALRVDLTKRDQENLVLPLFDSLAGGLRVTGTGGIPIPAARVAIRTSYDIDLRDLTARARFLGTVADDVDRSDVRLFFDLQRKPDGTILYGQFAPGNYEFRVTAPGYKPAGVRMRAREPWTVAHIATLLPGLDPTAVVPLRLTAVPRAPREEKSAGD